MVARTICTGLSLFYLPQACCTLLWGSEDASLSALADLPASKRDSQSEGCFVLSQLSPRGTGPILIPFFFSFFNLAQPHGWSFLQFWLYEICQHSVGILWNCFPCRCVFDVWVGSKIHIFLSILISPETNIFDLSHMRSDFLASVHDLHITCLHRISQASCLCRFPNQRKESKLFWQ